MDDGILQPNPARWKGHLVHSLPSRGEIAKVVHHRALAFADMPAFMAALAERDGIGARALEFLILTAARTGEVIGARWSEIDLDAQLWTVPAGRMKGGREHRVPLSDRAVAILAALPREADFVFPGGRKGVPISNMAMAQLLKRMDRTDSTVHGFRSTFRDWAAEAYRLPEPRLGNGAGACDRQPGRGRLPARRPNRAACPPDGRLGACLHDAPKCHDGVNTGEDKMSSLVEPNCSKRQCRHWICIKGDYSLVCKAFPRGIPDEIAYGDHLHLKPYPGDHGIQYEPPEARPAIRRAARALHRINKALRQSPGAAQLGADLRAGRFDRETIVRFLSGDHPLTKRAASELGQSVGTAPLLAIMKLDHPFDPNYFEMLADLVTGELGHPRSGPLSGRRPSYSFMREAEKAVRDCRNKNPGTTLKAACEAILVADRKKESPHFPNLYKSTLFNYVRRSRIAK